MLNNVSLEIYLRNFSSDAKGKGWVKPMIINAKWELPMADRARVEGMKRQILDRLRTGLRDREISYQEASERAGQGAQYVSKMLRKGSNPTLDSLIQVCLSNDIDLFELVLDSDEVQRLIALRSMKRGLPGDLGSRQIIAQQLQADWAERMRREGVNEDD